MHNDPHHQRANGVSSPQWLQAILARVGSATDVPAPAPPPAPVRQEVAARKPGNGFEIVQQWICYTLWEAALISLIVLCSALMHYYTNKGDLADYSYITYMFGIAACLVPLAFWGNRAYARIEPAQKQGFASVTMVLNALGVFLVSVGALITGVVSFLALFVSSNPTTGTRIVMWTALLTAVLGALLFGRIANYRGIRHFHMHFLRIVLGVSVLAMLFVLFGPIASTLSTRQDRLIEYNISAVDSDIYQYTKEHHFLPSSLNDIDASDDEGAQVLLDKDLVEYIPDAKQGHKDQYGDTVYYYTLCVTYETQKGTKSQRELARHDQNNRDGYFSMDSIAHDAGRICYKRSTY